MPARCSSTIQELKGLGGESCGEHPTSACGLHRIRWKIGIFALKLPSRALKKGSQVSRR